MVNIDYPMLGEAVTYYKNLGYKYVEVPWVVSNKVTDATLPEEAGRIVCNIRPNILVGSAEQGFLSLVKKNLLQPGNYVACTPCFRDDIEDDIHFKYFMKVELYNDINPTETTLQKMISDAMTFFSKYVSVYITPTGYTSWDICATNGNIELGSYGIREVPGFRKWVYGTGLALPRLSQVL